MAKFYETAWPVPTPEGFSAVVSLDVDVGAPTTTQQGFLALLAKEEAERGSKVQVVGLHPGAWAELLASLKAAGEGELNGEHLRFFMAGGVPVHLNPHLASYEALLCLAAAAAEIEKAA